jgi:hypothetical protein
MADLLTDIWFLQYVKKIELADGINTNFISRVKRGAELTLKTTVTLTNTKTNEYSEVALINNNVTLMDSG